MKKILITLFIFLNFTNLNASMSGLEKVQLLVEDVGSKPCGLSRDKIIKSAKYILLNSKLKFTTEFSSKEPLLYIQPIILGGDVNCSGVVKFQVKKYSQKDPLGKMNVGDFLYYDQAILVRGGRTGFDKYYLDTLEEYLKEFIIEWSEWNNN